MLLRRVSVDSNLSMVSYLSYNLQTHKAHHEQVNRYITFGIEQDRENVPTET